MSFFNIKLTNNSLLTMYLILIFFNDHLMSDGCLKFSNLVYEPIILFINKSQKNKF
jgi:hypothetical protein